MATIWSIIAFWILPIPLVLFTLLTLPLPRNMRRGLLIFTQRVFDVPVVGAFKLLHVMLWLTAVAFLGSARQAHMIKTAGQEAVWTTPNMEISHLSKRWRSERNLWMTAFAFCAWVFLAALYREASRRLDLEARLSEMERSDFTATETREPSVSREVTSKAAAAAAASRDRTPTAGSPNKTAATAAHPAAAELVGSAAGGSSPPGGIQMQELKKTA
ncbi:expressed protein [Chlorella variabilis]|uniref:Expressed protein n=1 Tax=Chlorella variabilis TaxID=554065 RepID=E1Z663_CHLVA|nr:expressed protein [Chlorella variabilis]EFN58593.1 expressed protein [Chlorella variabilis]|eukprot:XP_005850695.1 expressed protein [Chlorella variabilis]